jgi:SAM-dependent methyltransferase
VTSDGRASAAGNEVAPDGSPIDVYRRLPTTGEPELIHSLLPRAATILDVGCGPGRIAGPLVSLGHGVTGIDDAPAMIEALPAGVAGVVADAASIRLGRSFDAVLLLSHLINDPDQAPAFAATARAHLGADGLVIGESYPLDWDPVAAVGRTTRAGPVEIRLVEARRVGDEVAATVEYAVDGRSWEQPFRARLLDEPALRSLLLGADLAFERWLERPGWFTARPVRSIEARRGRPRS